MKKFLRSISAILASVLILATTALAAPLPSTSLYVVTSPGTPASKVLNPGQLNADVFYFDLYSRTTEGAQMMQISFQYKGLNNGDELTVIRLIDLDASQQIGNSAFLKPGGLITFSGLSANLPKNQKRRFALKVDVNGPNFAKAGENFAFSVDSVTAIGLASTQSLLLKKPANWSSNSFTFAGTSQLTLSTSAFQPPTNIMPGFDQPVFYFNIKNSGQNAVSLKTIVYEYTFSGQPTVSAFHVRNLATQKVLATSIPMSGMNSLYVCSLSPNSCILAPNTTVQFAFTADILQLPGFGNTFQLVVKDMDAVDTISGEKVAVAGIAQSTKIVGN